MLARLLPVFLFFIAALVSAPATAQEVIRGCATNGRSAWIDAYQAGHIKPIPKSLDVKFVPVHLTLVGDDNGAGYADPLTVLQSFELLNEDFAKINVRFYIDNDIDYLNSTLYYDHDFSTGADLMSNFNRPNTVNSYIVGNPAGACGYYSGRGDGIALGINCISPGERTWSHEVGHFFGLPHTFYGWESKDKISNVDAFDKPAPTTLNFNGRTVEVERVDGSNCEDAADGFCDTAPDYLPERWRCNSLGIYPDSLLDPDSTRFAVSAENIMSYAYDGCVESFSPSQITAMNTNLGGRVGLESRTTPTFTAARAEDVTLLSPAQNETVQFSDSMQLVWNSVPNADFYLVQLHISQNFNGSVFTSFFTSDTSAVVTDILNPNTRYYWRVRPVNRYDVSGSFSDIQRFRNGAYTTATVDPELDAGITISPNPASAQGQLTVRGTGIKSGGELTLQLIDPSGRIIADQPRRRVGDHFTASLPVAGLPAGLYFVRLRLDDRLVTRRIVITP
ncbi:T9SS type A sorting domain-containing protein [Neolewinella litorea]|uniref:T9SS type A sorting domain-containing protein n=1 Tax=Neolewinella litorea TaxID=2562452 RepID=A0A4S4P017_9BACT|nr:T9SS type A sorting domain-containing protein [Neolewinella litorea]THH41910.1 T9SS type A sorting domain-containing protein [Neolewinella litorea]